MNLIAIQKRNLANAADRYLVNDPTVTWDQFKTSIDGVERATQDIYDDLDSSSSAKLFNDPSLGRPYRAFMVGLADRKQGLLPRMQMAAREVDQLTREGGSVQGAKAKVKGAKAKVKSEANALRTEATGLEEAVDALGAFLGKVSCQ